MDYWNLPILMDEQVYGDIDGIQTVEIRIDWNRDVIFGSEDVDVEICRIWNSDSFHSASIIHHC